jgi:DNA invertase Pin-like site-specific DNA recombinase
MGRGEDLTSPELQEHVVRNYCQRRGYEPLEWLCDVDLSGRSWSRRQTERAVRMIETHEADVIVVPRWSRFTRNLRDYVMHTARVEAAGGRVESALEETDPATAAGLLQRDLFAILAQWESRKIGEQWRETHQRRIREGLPHRMAPRMGYRIVSGRYRRHPTEGPVVAELYDRYLDGTGMVALTHWLAGQGVMSPRTGQRWSGRGLQLYMASGFAAGLLHVGQGHLPGAHTPLIAERVWKGYNRARVERWEGSTLRMGAAPAGLQGLVFCGSCGGQMRLKDEWSTAHERMRGYLYVCSNGSFCALRGCITRTRLEAHVRQWICSLVDESDRAPQVSALPKRRQLTRLVEQWSDLEPSELNAAVSRLIRRVVVVRRPGRRQRIIDIYSLWDDDEPRLSESKFAQHR